MARLSPSVLSKKMHEGGQLQDELTPRLDPCYEQELEGSWTHKETEYAVV